MNFVYAAAIVGILVLAGAVLMDRLQRYQGRHREVGLAILDDRPPCEPGWTAAVLTDEQRAALLARYKQREGDS